MASTTRRCEARRRRAKKPTRPRPASIRAWVSGSGTAETLANTRLPTVGKEKSGVPFDELSEITVKELIAPVDTKPTKLPVVEPMTKLAAGVPPSLPVTVRLPPEGMLGELVLKNVPPTAFTRPPKPAMVSVSPALFTDNQLGDPAIP